MIYTKDNIVGLNVQRGGHMIYTIRNVYSNTIEMIYGSRVCFCTLANGLKYLEKGRWTVVRKKVPVEQIYQIY